MQVTERDENGRFIKGHSGNPNGRPKKDRERRYYEIMQSACTFKEWRIIVQRAVEDAQKGDAAARKWLSDYLLGPPPQKLDVMQSGEVTINVVYGDGANRKS